MTNLLDTLVDFSDGRICPVKKPIVLPKSENGYINVYKELMESKILCLPIVIKNSVRKYLRN